MAPFGGILTANHWAQGVRRTTRSSSGTSNLNVKPALAEKCEIVSKTRRRSAGPEARASSSTTARKSTSADVKYSVEKMLNPPLPGSISTVGAGAGDRLGVDVVSKYVVRLHLKEPRRARLRLLRVAPLLADRARGPLRPDQRQPQRDRHRARTGWSGSNPNDRVEYVANQSFWKKGLPYMDAMTLKTLPDEQARIAALRAGAIDGATVSVRRRRGAARTTATSSS